MRRRTFLMWTAAGTAAAGIPVLGALRRTDDEDLEMVWRAGEPNAVLDAFTVGTRTGRPVLVLLADEADGQWGSIWAQALLHGDAELMADLSLCELVCAAPREIGAALPGYPGIPKVGGGLPHGVLLETSIARSTSVDVVLPEVPYGVTPEERDQALRARLALLGGALRRALLPNSAVIDERAEFALAATGLRCPEDPIATPDVARRLPAVLRRAGERDPGRRGDAIHQLAGVAAERFRGQPPRGAHWARVTGCGYEVEGLPEASPGFACGMGHVSDLGRRFLYHVTQS